MALHRMVRELPQSKPDGFASSLWEGAFGMTGKFPAKVQSLRAMTERVKTLSFTTPSVKMCLERPAGRDKHEIINNFSAEYAQSATEGISNRTTTKEATRCQSGSCGESRL